MYINSQVKPLETFFSIPILNKKLKRFVTNLPLFIEYTIIGNTITFYEFGSENKPSEQVELLSFQLYKDLPLKQNLALIKKLLLPHFPKFITRKTIECITTSKVTYDLVSSKEIEIQDVSPRGYYKTYFETCIIDKIIMSRDELFVKNLSFNTYHRYRSKIPVVRFLKLLNSIDINSDDKATFFNRTTVYTQEII